MDLLEHIAQMRKQLDSLERAVREQHSHPQQNSTAPSAIAQPPAPAAVQPPAYVPQPNVVASLPTNPIPPVKNMPLDSSVVQTASSPYDYDPVTRTFTRKPSPPFDWDRVIATWLPRIFIVVFLIGVLWGFSAAVNAGWINEPVRCLLGVAAGAVMFWLGERQVAKTHFALGQVLIGGSVAVLLLSLFSAHMLYHLIPAAPAFILYVAIVALGLFAAARHRSQALMLVMMIAGYLVPALVDASEPNVRVLVVYETLFSIAMLVLSHRYNYRLSFYFAYGLLQVPLALSYWLIDTAADHRVFFVSGVIIQHLAMLALFVLRGESAKRVDQTIILYTSFGLLVGWSAGLYESERFVFPTIVALFAVLYGGLAWWQHRHNQTYEVYMSIATAAGFFWLTRVLNMDSVAAAWIAEGTIAILLGVALRSLLQQITGGVVFVLGAIATLFNPIDTVWSSETVAWTTLVAAFVAAYVLFGRMERAVAWRPFRKTFAWIAAGAGLLLVSQVTWAATKLWQEDIRSLTLSAVWTAYAVAAVVFGIRRSHRGARLAGIGFLLLILLKVIFLDLPFVSMGVRAALFLGLGGIGVALSRLFYKRSEPKDPQ